MVQVIELWQDNNVNANEISIVLPSNDDLWVALCALTPVSTTNRPFLDGQQTHTHTLVFTHCISENEGVQEGVRLCR